MIIIIKAYWQPGFPWLSLAICLYWSSPLINTLNGQVTILNTNNLHIVKCFKDSSLTLIILFNNNHLFAQLYSFMYSYPILIIFKQIYLTNMWDPDKSITSDQSRLRSNNNEGVLHTGASLSDAVQRHIQDVILWHPIAICYAVTPNRRLHHHGSQQTLVVLQHEIDVCTTTILMGLWV